MSLFTRGYNGPWPPAQAYIPARVTNTRGRPQVNNESALRHSAVWACLRLRANLISTLPLQTFRTVNGIDVQVPPAPVLLDPQGDGMDMDEWLWATQFDLDRAGNTFGIIKQRNAYGLPSTIELVPVDQVSAVIKQGVLTNWRIGSELQDPKNIWHEKQYPAPGLAVGLSPIAHAAWSIGEYLSIQEFAQGWFGNGGIPAGHLKNTAKTLQPEEAAAAKERFRATTTAGDAFVSGADWEFNVVQGANTGNDWVNAKQFSIVDIARFFDCPGDLIDAAVSGTAVTYANVVQRNLQFLIMHLNPALIRRERRLSKLLPSPRFAKFDRKALLEMDPLTQAQYWNQLITARSIAPDEIRAAMNKAPFTQDQIDQILTFYPPHSTYEATAPLTPTGSSGGSF